MRYFSGRYKIMSVETIEGKDKYKFIQHYRDDGEVEVMVVIPDWDHLRKAFNEISEIEFKEQLLRMLLRPRGKS